MANVNDNNKIKIDLFFSFLTELESHRDTRPDPKSRKIFRVRAARARYVAPRASPPLLQLLARGNTEYVPLNP